MIDDYRATGIKKIRKEIPLGRLGLPEEIARTVLFLIGEENTYITGQNLVIDPGKELFKFCLNFQGLWTISRLRKKFYIQTTIRNGSFGCENCYV